jgi:DNA-binding SARP family transcriptional activator
LTLSIQMLGELDVRRDGEPVALPASKKTRALLAYLALTARPQRRDRLCEVLWELPDDPRAALRWSLNKLRRIVNDSACERLVADRERVALQIADIEIDVRAIEARLDDAKTVAELSALADRLAEPLLEALDLPNQPVFQRWLEAERLEVGGWRARVLERLAQHPDLTVHQALQRSRDWLEADPFEPRAAAHLLVQLQQTVRAAEADALSRELTGGFRSAGI